MYDLVCMNCALLLRQPQALLALGFTIGFCFRTHIAAGSERPLAPRRAPLQSVSAAMSSAERPDIL